LPIDDSQLKRLLQVLAEAERADETTAERFVEPRTGILEEVSARRHYLVVGRRGVGKSTLLLRVKIGSDGDPQAAEREVILIDIETLRRRPYPDVLIELLKELLADLEDRLRDAGLLERWRRRGLLSEVRALEAAMSQLLLAPQSAEHTVRVLRSQSRLSTRSLKGKVGGRFSKGLSGAGIDAEAEASAGVARRNQSQEDSAAEARFEKTKMDGLAEAAVHIRKVLGAAQNELAVPTLLVLDDFYHVPSADQPEVLAYLHQLVKGLDIWLKVCGVRHRLNPFADGDPPVGMQPDHDAGVVSPDITLERFEAAKLFLERVLAGISDPLGVSVEELASEGGRERLVLGSGGVARDYLSLTRRALRNSNERAASQWRPRNRITAEDVAEAAAASYDLKQEELKRDAGEDAEAVRARLSNVVRFCVEHRRTNVFLVETTKLQEEPWGREIQALAELRFVHRIGTMSTKRGGEAYPGRKFAAFTLDLSTWTSTRSEQISQIPFWTPEGRQQVRSPAYIYTPERAREASERPAETAEPSHIADALEPGEQLAWEFDDPE
jgi:hypothetical protein